MDLIYGKDKVITDWERQVSGCEFARIETTRAVYDKVAIVGESDRNIAVEFPAHKQSKENEWTIRKEVIPRSEILSFRVFE
jgi:hypothetical protein